MEDERRPSRPRSLMDEKMMAASLMELRYPSLRGLSADVIIARTSFSSSSCSANIAQKPKAAALMEIPRRSLHGLPAEETIRQPSSSSTAAKITLKKSTVAAKTTTTIPNRRANIVIKFGYKSMVTSSDHSGENKVTKIRIKSHKSKHEFSRQANNPSPELQSPVPMNSASDLKKSYQKGSSSSSRSPPRHDRLWDLIVPRQARTARPRAQMVSSMPSRKRKSWSSSSEEAPRKKRTDGSSPSTVLHLHSSLSSDTCSCGGFVVEEPSLAEVRRIESVQEPMNKNRSPGVHSPKTEKLSFDLNEPWIGDKEGDGLNDSQTSSLGNTV